MDQHDKFNSLELRIPFPGVIYVISHRSRWCFYFPPGVAGRPAVTPAQFHSVLPEVYFLVRARLWLLSLPTLLSAGSSTVQGKSCKEFRPMRQEV